MKCGQNYDNSHMGHKICSGFLEWICNSFIWVRKWDWVFKPKMQYSYLGGQICMVIVISWISNGILEYMWVLYFVKILIIFKQQLPNFAWYMHMGGNIGVGLSTKLAIYRFGSQNILWLIYCICNNIVFICGHYI
jgi:hypothetical protein